MDEDLEERALSFLKHMVERYPPSAEECDIMLDGIRLSRFVSETECYPHCKFDCEDHTINWLFPTKVCLKDALAHGYKLEWNKYYQKKKEVNTVTTDNANQKPQEKATFIPTDMAAIAKLAADKPVTPAPVAEIIPPPVNTAPTLPPTPAPGDPYLKGIMEKPAPVIGAPTSPPPTEKAAETPATDTKPAGDPPAAAPAIQAPPPAAPEPAKAAAPAPPKEIETEINLTITLKKSSALIGIQRTGTDPVFFPMSVDLRPRLTGLNGFIQEAERRWAKNPKYPAAAPTTAPAKSAATKTAPAKPVKPAAPKAGEMKSML